MTDETHATDAATAGQADAPAMSELDRKVTTEFSGYTVRKDLVGKVKGNALVPSYVLEYLLGKYATTTDEDSVQSGVERVRAILADNYVHREEANLIQSKIREKGQYNVIDKVQVALNDKEDRYEATFENLGIGRVVVGSQTIKDNPKLLVTGIWCMCTLAYAYTGDPKDVPWRLMRLRPVQMSHDDREHYLEMRARFTADEWVDLLMQSVGFNPDMFSSRAKLLHLVRMVPFVERNYNLIELGPKGTGKSHIYSEFSPHGMLISGGEVTAAKLFVNNTTGQIGLVGYWDTVAFDEFAGKTKKADRALVDIMKNYMANKSFSRGRNTMQAEASMVFVGNTSHNVPYMLKNTDLFEELPPQYHDPAFLDRVHCYVPGWEFEQIRAEMFTGGYGFVVDYLAEILHNLRNVDYGSAYERYFTLSPTLSTRDKDGVRKTFSGLMKLVYPSGEATPDEMEPLLRCAIEGRKRVKDQLCRIDPTMAEVDFSYTRVGSPEPVAVHTLEEDDYPELYWRGKAVAVDADEVGDVMEVGGADAGNVASDGNGGNSDGGKVANAAASAAATDGTAIAAPTAVAGSAASSDAANEAKPTTPAKPAMTRIERIAATAQVKYLKFAEGRIGISYNKLFGPYVAGAKRIIIQDPYIRQTYQARNLAEFLETVYALTERADEVQVHLITGQADDTLAALQLDNLQQLQDAYGRMGIILTYEFSATAHDRSIVTDTGWEISLGRGLDIFQRYDESWLNPQLRQQSLRRVKQFTVHYMRKDQDE
ncbi:BREX system Lon protease-like protein BrxL [Bifidobacterium leontopitheci]|uniref:ATP-dependent Lon protease n=1 Tax=Bifidobacterium leontopitheci TaxID=2650774 RepID=A0A6I1GKM2_9BIFI|nr:BREX system Lon protease-like protein BrxL [Bifidobacterium leontopitheci]KAB7791322.1 ATP-dependent Lon protease [Bifidobacterium leontopitheci]